MRDGMSGEGGLVVANADRQSAPIFVHIVDAVGDSYANGIGAEIVIVDATWGAFPTTPRIFEVANQLALLGVDANNGQMAALETVAQMGKIFELPIAVRSQAGRDLLVIDAQRVAHLLNKAPYSVGRNGNAECRQFRGD